MPDLNLQKLISQIQSLDTSLKQEANKAVNRLLTMRNWLIGYYIVEYEQKGEDKAKYGNNLLNILSRSLDIKGLSETNLKINRLFYISYPQIRQILPNELQNNIMEISQTPSDELQNITIEISQTLSDELQNIAIGISQTPSDELQITDNQLIENNKLQPSYEAQLNKKIIDNLSFSHITLLLPLNDPYKRAFYAIEAIKGTWSVRELKRQINSLLFERSGISKKPEQLLQNLHEQHQKNISSSFIKDLYTFEFLGLPERDAVEEDDIETALLNNLQQFLLEMGHGFCLEARQKRILIGDEYYFIDLIFYHRVLKCHVLIDLKVEEFNHNNVGQLNTYLNYYKKEIQTAGDNAPIGILMVTNKNDALVEYATAGMDEQLFVRKYLLQLPDKKEIEAFIKNELRTL
jgi:predicted nuclease of restriction endonuclease-like (RecB) superfamily